MTTIRISVGQTQATMTNMTITVITTTMTKVTTKMRRKPFAHITLFTLCILMMFSTVAYASPVQKSSNASTLAKKQYLKSIASYNKNLFSEVVSLSALGQKCLDKKITFKVFQTNFAKDYAIIKTDLAKIQKTRCPSGARTFKAKYDALLKQYVTWVGTLKNDIRPNRSPVPGSQKREATKAQYFSTAFKKLTS
jgi:hypothetical protein